MTDTDWDDCWAEFDNAEKKELESAHGDDELLIPGETVTEALEDSTIEFWTIWAE